MTKKQITSTIVVIATIILGGVAVYTATRLYSLRQEAVAPTAPESKPAAAEDEIPNPIEAHCDTLAFTLGTPTPTPSDSPTPTPTGTPEDSPTPTPTTPSTTSTPSITTTSTPEPALTDAGVSFPTLLSAGLGILVIVASVFLFI